MRLPPFKVRERAYRAEGTPKEQEDRSTSYKELFSRTFLRRFHSRRLAADIQTKKSGHITPIVRELHWLPVEMRIDYILSLVYSCINGTAHQYLRELIPRYIPVHYLRSSTQSRLRIPSVDQGNNHQNKTKNPPGSRSIFQCCTQTGTVCPLL